MIQSLVDRFMAADAVLRAQFAAAHPSAYKDVVAAVVRVVTNPEEYGDDALDPERIHQIDDGDYQGTLVFVIAAKGYQPSDYWYVKVSYGSCSGCDTLQAIHNYSDEPPTPEQVDDYMTLALHVVQGLKLMGDSDA
jgi:hypothetical protein